MKLALKSTTRTVRHWRNWIMFGLTMLIIIATVLVSWIAAKQNEQRLQYEFNYQVALLKPYVADWSLNSLSAEQMTFLEQRFHLFNQIHLIQQNNQQTLINHKTKPTQWLSTTSVEPINGKLTVAAQYTALSHHYIQNVTLLVTLITLVINLLLFVMAKLVEVKLFKIERKARKLGRAKRRSEYIKQSSLMGLLDSLLDELAWSRTEQTRIDKFVRKQTFLDSELGIGNRLFFDHRLEAALNTDEKAQSGAVLLLHFQQLDQIENLYGASKSREVLLDYCQMITQTLTFSPEPLLCRRGYMELAIIFMGMTEQELTKHTELLMRKLRLVELPKEMDIDSFYHIGLATFSAGDSAYQVLSEADMALRSAQLEGPSNWFIFEDDQKPKAAVMGSLKWRTLLERSINQENFTLLFQPVVHKAQAIHHQEALIRLPDEQGSTINAAVFLPMARKCGLQAKIETIVIKKLFNLFQQDSNSRTSTSLNISIDSLLNSQFVDSLYHFLQQQEQHRDRLIIAINEYGLSQHSEALKTVLSKLNRLGVRLLVDQVGQYVVHSGYVREHPIAYLKLHISIVKNVEQRPENQLFIRSLKSAVASSDTRVFADGVDNDIEWQMLASLHIDGGQGLYFNPVLTDRTIKS